MKVRDMRSDRKVMFKEISVGTVISLETGLWVKVKPFIDIDSKYDRELPMNLVRLEDGLFARASSDEIVSPVELEIEIHDYNLECENHEEEEKRKIDFLEFLVNHINPNEMEKYRTMYESKGDPTEGSEK